MLKHLHKTGVGAPESARLHAAAPALPFTKKRQLAV